VKREVFERICNEMEVADTPAAKEVKELVWEKCLSEEMTPEDLRSHLEEQKMEYSMARHIFEDDEPYEH